MKTVYIKSILIVSAAIWFAANNCRADQADDEAAIRKTDDAYAEAYNKRDAKALAALWSPEAVYIDPETGDEAVGRDEIEKEFADTFAALKDAKLEIEVASINFFSPNVAIENGTARIIRPDAEPERAFYACGRQGLPARYRSLQIRTERRGPAARCGG